MELYTLNRNFIKQDAIDIFQSIIWTERYNGNSEVELVVPATVEMFRKLPLGIFFSIESSDEVMILETMNGKDGTFKYNGISLLPWMNNRFVRTSKHHEDQYWYIENKVPGEIVWMILYNMCCAGSPYLDETIDTKIDHPERFIIPGLVLKGFPTGEAVKKVGIPYGPVYEKMAEIATTYNLGMKITLDDVTESSYSLGFLCYRGLDRTTDQTENLQVRFSPEMDSFTNIEELQSIKDFKTIVYSWAPGLKSEPDGPELTHFPGKSSIAGVYTGFDLRAMQIFVSDITSDMVEGDADKVLEMLESRAKDEIAKHKFVKSVDGEIVPESQFKYGVHYNLGDIIEVEGNTGVIQRARITEYIQSQDEIGEKAYPTVDILD